MSFPHDRLLNSEGDNYKKSQSWCRSSIPGLTSMVHKHYPSWTNGPNKSVSEEKRPTKEKCGDSRWTAAGPPSSAFTELSDVCKEEVAPDPILSLPPLGTSGAPRTVRGSQRIPSVHMTVLLLSPGMELATPAARAQVMFCSNHGWFLPRHELSVGSEDGSPAAYIQEHTLTEQGYPLQKNPWMYKRHLQTRH